MKTSPLIIKIIVFVTVVLADHQVFSQKKFEISAGAGFPEMIALRVKYGKVVQVGLSQSVFSLRGPNTLDLYYNFAGKSGFTDQPPWYVMGGLGFFSKQKGGIYYDEKGSPLCFYSRIGRQLNLSRGTGLSIEGGAIVPFWDFGVSVVPALCFSFFVRL